MKRRLKAPSMGFVAIGVFIASIAIGGAAYAASSSYGWNYYYAQTGLDGNIYCAGGTGEIKWPVPGAPSSIISGTSATQTRRDLYCSNVQNAPAGYIQAKVSVIKGGILCVQTNWASNDPGTNIATNGINPTLSSCGGAGSYRAFGEHQAALDYQWRYGNYYTGFISAG